ncbi:unnamed protein product, partial [Ceratitis capitata]
GMQCAPATIRHFVLADYTTPTRCFYSASHSFVGLPTSLFDVVGKLRLQGNIEPNHATCSPR